VKVCHSTTPKGEKHTDKDLAQQWNSIDWKDVRSNVSRLQTRIAKATQKGKWNLVKQLSYLLTHSHSAKMLSVRIVTQNKGKRTPGVDGELWKKASEKMQAVLSLTDRQYSAQPLRRIYIPKPGKNTKRHPPANCRNDCRPPIVWIQTLQIRAGCITLCIHVS